MKYSKIAISLLFCIFAFLGFSQSRLSLNSGQFTKITQSIPTRSVEYVDDGVIVTYSIPTADEISTAGSNEIIWGIQGFTNNTGEGNPAVPMRNDIFSFEGSANVSVELIEENHTDYMVNIAPFTGPEQQSSVVMKPYEGFFPESPIFLRGKEEYRGNDISYVAVCPVQYDYENSIARAYTKLVYKISYAESPLKAQRRTPGGESGAQRQFSGVNTFANVAIPLVKNEEENPILKSSGSGDILATPEDFLIITTPTCYPAANKFARWKRILGYKVYVSSRSVWDETNIKSTISGFYSSKMNPTYVLFLGNASDIPPQNFEIYTPPSFNTQERVTDYLYMCMGEEGDNLADLIFGRIPANDANEANIAIDKIIRYEQGIELSSSNMSMGLNIAYFQENKDFPGEEYSQAIRTSEEIKNYLESKESKTVERIYYKHPDVTPLYYSASVGSVYRSSGRVAIPEEVRISAVWQHPFLSAMHISNAWKKEPLYVIYIGHSMNDRWCEPIDLSTKSFLYAINNISGLSEVKNPPFLFSMSCDAGSFEKDECIAKEFLCKKELPSM